MSEAAGWSFAKAIEFTRSERGLSADLHPSFSNAPIGLPAERGGALGGLVAALVVRSAREELAIDAPLQSLSVQFLAAAKFEPIEFVARRVRGGRSIAYVSIEGRQGPRVVVQAFALFSSDGPGPDLSPLRIENVPPPESLPVFEDDAPTWPWFHRHFEYRFLSTPKLVTGDPDARERLWMRTRGGAPLGDASVCALLDAIYPTFWIALGAQSNIAATADYHVELMRSDLSAAAPDGWVLAEFRTLHVASGWAVEDAICFGRDGRAIAAARQRRKVLPATAITV